MSEQCCIVRRHTVKVFYQKFSAPSRPRRHTLSHASPSPKIVFDLEKVSPTCVLVDLLDDVVALGSFTPTDSATISLRSLAASKSSNIPPVAVHHRRQRRSSLSTWYINFDVLSPSSSTLNSPLSINTTVSSVPSITRTTSSYFVPDTPSPTGSPTAVSVISQPEEKVTTTDLSPIFASLERSSKLCAPGQYCAICKKPGKDYPRCRKCGEMWCSRECRLHDGAKRHLCSRKDREQGCY